MSMQPTLYFLDGGTGAATTSMDEIATAGSILSCSADGSNQKTIISGLARPDGLDISQETHRIYWTNMGPSANDNNGSIMSVDLNGTDVRTVLSPGKVHTPKQIVIDKRTSKLYFC